MVAFVAKARVILPHGGGVRGENFRVFLVRRCNIRFIGLFRKPAVDRRKQEKQRKKARGGKRREKQQYGASKRKQIARKGNALCAEPFAVGGGNPVEHMPFCKEPAENPAAKRRKTRPRAKRQKRQMQCGVAKPFFGSRHRFSEPPLGNTQKAPAEKRAAKRPKVACRQGQRRAEHRKKAFRERQKRADKQKRKRANRHKRVGKRF